MMTIQLFSLRVISLKVCRKKSLIKEAFKTEKVVRRVRDLWQKLGRLSTSFSQIIAARRLMNNDLRNCRVGFSPGKMLNSLSLLI